MEFPIDGFKQPEHIARRRGQLAARRRGLCAWLVLAATLAPGTLSAQENLVGADSEIFARGPGASWVRPSDYSPDVHAAPRAMMHETPVGAFIDPLVTEHAFVDRKVRSDFHALFPRESTDGNAYVNAFIFEYAFTNWFGLELVQPLVFLNPEAGPSRSGLGDLGWGAKFELLHGPESGNVILSVGVEGTLPSGSEDVGAGEEWEVAPFLALDYAIGNGIVKLQSNAEAEYAIPRDPDEASQWEAIVWNAAFSFYPSQRIVPLLEFNSAWEAISEDTRFSLAITPGVVISLSGIAGTYWDIAAGAQLFVGDERDQDVTAIVSIRYHWPFGRWSQGQGEEL